MYGWKTRKTNSYWAFATEYVRLQQYLGNIIQSSAQSLLWGWTGSSTKMCEPIHKSIYHGWRASMVSSTPYLHQHGLASLATGMGGKPHDFQWLWCEVQSDMNLCCVIEKCDVDKHEMQATHLPLVLQEGPAWLERATIARIAPVVVSNAETLHECRWHVLDVQHRVSNLQELECFLFLEYKALVFVLISMFSSDLFSVDVTCQFWFLFVLSAVGMP